jgi:DNA-binding GntR family transcriptional regulator
MDFSDVAKNSARRYKTAQAMVADGLREAILRGAVEGGRALRQEDIAEQFGVSRGPVREALRQLQGEGLVELHDHRGAVVSALSDKEVKELSEIRIALETLAIRVAIPRMAQDDLRRAEEILNRADDEPDLAARWGEFNWEFHSALYVPADRPRLMGMIEPIHSNFERYLRVYVLALDYEERGQKEHRQILELCKRGDVDGAADLLGRHVGYVGEMIAEALRESQGARTS